MKSQNLWLKTPVGVEAAAAETPSLTGEFVGETQRGLEHTQTQQLGKQHQKSPIWLWVAGGVTENLQRAEQAPLLHIGPLPHVQHHSSGEHLSLRPFT